MSQEIFWLVLTVFMTSLFWLPYILNQLAVLGVLEAMRESAPVTDRLAPWAQRAKRAHANAVENLVIFAPLVIAVYALNVA